MSDFISAVLVLAARCVMCGAEDSVTVADADFQRYMHGAYVQVAFAEMPVDDREIVIGWRSGCYVCPRCFPPEPEE